jgi:hypothetical protein
MTVLRSALIVAATVSLITHSAVSEDLIMSHPGKMPPATCGPDCVQIVISNRSQETASFNLRRPGQNWRGYRLPPLSASNFSWHIDPASAVPNRLEATIGGADQPAMLEPGIEYEIQHAPGGRGLRIVPQGAASDRR